MTTQFNALNLANIERDKPVIVGSVTIKTPFTLREHYEYAAWFRDHELIPGTYPVIAARIRGIGPLNGDMQLAARIPTTIKAACLISGFGGVHYGPDSAGAKEVGKSSEYVLHVGHARHARACLNPGAKHYYDCGEGEGELRHSSGSLHTSYLDYEFTWSPEFQPTEESTS